MTKSRIIWGVDPFQTSASLLKIQELFLNQLAAKTKLPVEPVYVASPLELKIVLEFSVPEKNRFQTVALRQMNQFLKQTKMPSLLPPKILLENSPSVSQSVNVFAKYALKEKENLVVVGTQAKTGGQRFILGSFAESLLFCLKVPVILINPTTKKTANFKNILFATDFSDESKTAFAEICGLASKLHSKIIVHHKLDSAFGNKQLQEKNARYFIQKAKKWGIATSVIIEKTSLEKHDAILSQVTKSKIDMVALAAKSGKVATTLLGSTTRKVVRGCPVPVWVYRS